MRISDWSSDVCSSDLLCHGGDMGFLKTLFGDTSKKIPPKTNISIGHAVLQKYKPFITDKESAKKAALTVLWHGKTQFIDGPNGQIISASDSYIHIGKPLCRKRR